MESAFRNYVAYQHHEHSWLLGRFVCPAGRLTELGGLVAHWPDESPLRLSVVGGPSTDAGRIPRVTTDLGMVDTLQAESASRSDAATAVTAELGMVHTFQVQHRERVQI